MITVSPAVLAQGEGYLDEIPPLATVVADITGSDEPDTKARQLAALWAFSDLIKAKKEGGRFTGSLTPEAAKKLGEITAAIQQLFNDYQAQFVDRPEAWKSAYRLQLRYNMDAAFKLSIIERYIPQEAAFMAALYDADKAYKRSKGRQLVARERAEFLNEYGPYVASAVLAVIVLLLALIAHRTTRLREYSGVLHLVGEGLMDTRYGITRRSVLEIGDTVLRNVNSPLIISSYLESGEEMVLYIAPIYHAKFAYAVKREGRPIVKMGMGQLFLSLFLKLLLVGPFWLFWLGSSDKEIGIGFVCFGVAALYLLYRSFRAFKNYLSIRS